MRFYGFGVLGLAVSGLGFRVVGSSFSVLGFRVYFECRFEGFRVCTVGLWVEVFGFWGLGFRVQGLHYSSGFGVLGSGFRVLWFRVLGFRGLGFTF